MLPLLLRGSERIRRETSRDVRSIDVLVDDIEKRAPVSAVDSALVSVCFSQEQLRAALALSQVRDALFAQLYRQPGSKAGASRADYRHALEVYASLCLPQVATRLQELEQFFGTLRQGETGSSVVPTRASADLGGDFVGTLAMLSPFVVFLCALDALELAAHAHVLAQEYNRALTKAQVSYLEERLVR
jgi:hypothetical protein